MHYTYMLSCEDGSYYTGYTTNVERRFNEHKSGKGAKYTRSHKPDSIVYQQEFETRSEAMKHECALKKLTHEQKKQFVLAHLCVQIANSGILKETDNGITQ